MTQEAIENHHPDRKQHPKLTVKMTRKEHQTLHKIEVHNTPLSCKMREYDKVNTILVTMKNWSTAYQKDFGKTPNIGLEQASQLKKTLTKELIILVKSELPKVEHIKGIGPRYLAGILAYAHPSRFASLRKFLFYCGYTEASTKLKKYNRRIKPIIHQLTRGVIMCKNKKYYPLYLKIKEDLSRRYPDRCKKIIDVMARNRVGTYLLKEIYEVFRGRKSRGLIFSSTSTTEGLSLKSTLDLQT